MIRKSFYPGWRVLAACFFSAMLMIGGTLYVFQLFVLPVSEEFSLTRAQLSFAYISLLLGMAFLSPFAGHILDNYPARLIIPVGGICYATSLIILSQSTTLWLMLLSIILLGSIALCLAGGLAANAITSRWFLRRRGRALGIASVASSAGGFTMVPFMTWLIESHNWRDALLYAGVTVGIVVVLVGFFLIENEPTNELVAASDEFELGTSNTNVNEEIESTTWTLPTLIKNKNFWLIMLGAGLLLASDQAILTSKYPLFIDAGLTPTQAASIISTMTFSAIFGKFLVGYLADYVDVRHLFAMVALFHAALLLIFIEMPDYWILLSFASVFGAAVGGIYPVWSALTAANFGARNFGLVFGSMAPVMQSMASIFVYFIASSFDKSGSYNFAFYCFVVAVFTGMVLIYMVRKKPASDLAGS